MLANFLGEVLRMGKEGTPAGRGGRKDTYILPPSVTRHVRLEHVRDLWDIAQSLTEADWTSGVSRRFREELPMSLVREVAIAGDAMGHGLEVLLPIFKVLQHGARNGLYFVDLGFVWNCAYRARVLPTKCKSRHVQM